jgi:hypothetical protein
MEEVIQIFPKKLFYMIKLAEVKQIHNKYLNVND